MTLGDIIFGLADVVKDFGFEEIEKRVKKIILFFASVVLMIFGICFFGVAIFEYFKDKVVASLIVGFFFFVASLIVFLLQKAIK
jgi:hypothetical protein